VLRHRPRDLGHRTKLTTGSSREWLAGGVRLLLRAGHQQMPVVIACLPGDGESGGVQPLADLRPRPAAPGAHGRARGGWREEEAQSAWLASLAQTEPQRRALRQAQRRTRDLSLAQAQIRRAESAFPAMPARLSDALPAPAPAPRPRHPPAPSRAARASRSRVRPPGPAPHGAARHRHRLRDAPRTQGRPIQARNNSGQYPLNQQAQSRCLAGLTSYRTATRSATQHPETHGIIFELFPLPVWSYGDSNPRPLACHTVATRPQKYICAGHCLGTSASVPRNPGRLLYFRAVPEPPPMRAERARLPEDACWT
jgi:hypothetical protein